MFKVLDYGVADAIRGDCAMLGVGGTLWFGVHQAKYRGNFDVMIY